MLVRFVHIPRKCLGRLGFLTRQYLWPPPLGAAPGAFVKGLQISNCASGKILQTRSRSFDALDSRVVRAPTVKEIETIASSSPVNIDPAIHAELSKR